MPTESIPELLNRDLDKGLAKTLGQFAGLIEETVNFGTHVVGWVGKATQKRGDEALVITLFFRQALEILDSVSILVKSSSVDPSGAILLRALLETYFSAEYIISGTTHQERMRRARCFCVWNIHNEMKWEKKFDPTTQQGKQLISAPKSESQIPNGTNFLMVRKIFEKSQGGVGSCPYMRFSIVYGQAAHMRPIFLRVRRCPSIKEGRVQ